MYFLEAYSLMLLKVNEFFMARKVIVKRKKIMHSIKISVGTWHIKKKKIKGAQLSKTCS